LTVDPRMLAHCRACYEPMYYIYDQKLREFCYECTLEYQAQQGLAYDQLVQSVEESYL
jgi:hypothetical protein